MLQVLVQKLTEARHSYRLQLPTGSKSKYSSWITCFRNNPCKKTLKYIEMESFHNFRPIRRNLRGNCIRMANINLISHCTASFDRPVQSMKHKFLLFDIISSELPPLPPFWIWPQNGLNCFLSILVNFIQFTGLTHFSLGRNMLEFIPSAHSLFEFVNQ